MLRYIVLTSIFFIIAQHLIDGCLITNCPRGGKRNGKPNALDANVKPCVSCGPGRSGQCFGPSICCGPFGCLLGTPETIRCQRDGFFHEREPCIAGSGTCRKNSGRCAADGICCGQEACYADKSCSLEEKNRLQDIVPLDIYSLMNYPNQLEYNAE